MKIRRQFLRNVSLLTAALLMFTGDRLVARNLEPVALRREYRVNPLGVDEAQPRLTPRVESAGRGKALAEASEV